jgi:hypothetical protein
LLAVIIKLFVVLSAEILTSPPKTSCGIGEGAPPPAAAGALEASLARPVRV